MKRYLYFLIAAVPYSCSSQELQKKEIAVECNKNLEVLFTIYNQCWTPFLGENVSEYTLEHTKLMAFNYEIFKKYKDHKAVKLTKKILERSGTDFFLFGFYYDTFPSVKRINKIPDKILLDINPDATLALQEIDILMKEIANFYIEADFDSYFNENQYVYKKAIREVTENLPADTFILFMESYFGERKDSYTFTVIPFFKTEYGQAYEIVNHGKTDVYCFTSAFKPQIINQEGIVENVGFDNKKEVHEWIVHEFSHTFFNPHIDKAENLEALKQYKFLYKPIKDNPQIGNWYSLFAEHLAVAFEIRSAVLLGDSIRSEKILQHHDQWHYLDHFVEQTTYKLRI